jgi:predicted site-specific integrase-resolvase
MVISESDLRSTREAAQALGIHHITLQRYVSTKKVPAPALRRVGGVRVRLWSAEDIESVRRVLPKIANGRKHRNKRTTSKK